jgi:PadR family transcriptional regulator, regulatory protein PadR
LTKHRYLLIIAAMRRKPGVLIPLERSVLEAGVTLRDQGVEEFHGFLLAKELQTQGGDSNLTAYGTLYRALDRMEKAGLLSRRWEDPLIAAQETRPRRRLYQVTAAGAQALAEVHLTSSFRKPLRLKPRRGTP